MVSKFWSGLLYRSEIEDIIRITETAIGLVTSSRDWLRPLLIYRPETTYHKEFSQELLVSGKW